MILRMKLTSFVQILTKDMQKMFQLMRLIFFDLLVYLYNTGLNKIIPIKQFTIRFLLFHCMFLNKNRPADYIKKHYLGHLEYLFGAQYDGFFQFSHSLYA